MAALQVGLVLPTRGILLAGAEPAPARKLLDLARMAEGFGIDSLWVGDSLTAKPRLEPLATLAAVAAVTRRARLGTAVMLGALRQPVLLAQSAATVDLMSEGRLTLAMGVGGAFTPSQQAEWANAGVDREKRATRLSEVVRISRALWSGESVTFHGKHFDLDNVSLGFRAHQRPSIPVLLACHSGEGRERQYRRAATLGDGMISITDSPAAFGEVRKRVLEEVVRLGKDPARFRSVYYMTINLNHDEEAARTEADRWIKAYYGLNFWGDRWGPFGSPARVEGQIRDYVSAGADEVILRMASPGQEAQFERARDELLPGLRKP